MNDSFDEPPLGCDGLIPSTQGGLQIPGDLTAVGGFMAVMNAVFEELIAGANVFVLVVLAPAMKGFGITEAKLPDHLPRCCVESHWFGSS